MKLFLYVIIALVNFGFGAVFFIAAKRMAMAGANSLIVTGTMSAWAVAYALVSWGVSRVITEKNASKIMTIGGIIGTLSGLGFVLFKQNVLLYLWMFMLGFAGPMYCAPAQVLIRRVDTGKAGGGILQAAGKYTVSWSIGNSCGPLLTGLLWQLLPETGWMIPLLILAGAFAGMVAWSRLIDRCAPPPGGDERPKADETYCGYKDLVLTGWIFGGTGVFIISILRAYLPYKTNGLHIATFYEGLVIALITVSQAFFAWLLGRYGKYWMYRTGKMLFFCLAGIGSLLFFAFAQTTLMLCISAILFGLFSASFYVYFVFMSMLSPEKSAKNCSVNETVVGITTCIGPLAGGWIAFAGRDLPFVIMAVLLFLISAYVLSVTKKAAK